MSPLLFSIIIPVRLKTNYLRQTLKKLQQQTCKSFEVLVITDKLSGSANPAQKRNLGAKMSQGKYLAFIDDDSYPSKTWLESINKLFSPGIAAVCGPCLTPASDNIYQKASGLVWSSLLGSGGAGLYRNSVQKPMFVDDYPSVNLIVRKNDFTAVKGFDTHHWPGEDTILCLNLTKKLHQKILYHPSVIVYHHRRPVLIPHLQQISRYALHRGHFARVFPETSFKIGYLMPSLSVIYFIVFPILLPVLRLYYFIPFIVYLLLIFFTFISFLKKNNFLTSILATITIPLTHLYYGILFPIGFFKKNLSFKAHSTNKHGYIGG